MELLEESLDPLSDRYRICPNPNCKKPHMVKNTGRDYCSDNCADRHYNFLRKYRKQAETEKEKQAETEKFTNEALQLKVVDFKTDPDWLKAYNKNIELFSGLHLDPSKGTKYPLDHIVSLGVNLYVHTANGTLHNIDDKYGCKYLVIGDYKLFLIDHNTILIYYNNLEKLQS